MNLKDAVVLKTTQFPLSKKNPLEVKNVLKPGTNTSKLGFMVTNGKWKGKVMYSLTLTERETCPTYCHHWVTCYGKNMPFAHRFNLVGLEDKLASEIPILINKSPFGILIRLHVLGDFHSVEYVNFWKDQLEKHPKLSIFGYTGRWEDDIATAIENLNQEFSDQCVIRFSQNKESDSTHSFAVNESFEGDSLICPEQIGKIDDCASCGFCWKSKRAVKFLTH